MRAIPRPARTSAPVAFSPWQPNSWLLGAALALILGVSIGSAGLALWPRGWLGQHEYHLWRWEATNLVDNVFARMGIGPHPDDATGRDALQRYFALTTQIRAAQAAPDPDATVIDRLTQQRRPYENTVERLLERYIGEAVTGAGLERQLPLFDAVAFTWPPVDFELTTPPSLLVRSPRNTIRRAGDTLLEPGLTLSEAERIEARTDSADTVSIVVPVGGIAAYPAIVRDDRSYDSLLDTASHEWVHHYLAFFPLGEQWGVGRDGNTLNETTANIAGREIANLIRQSHPVTFPGGQDGRAPTTAAPTVDVNAVMHQLRLDVDALLADGKVGEAERLMEERRTYLGTQGVAIRKINQAYFAFYGTYGDTAASSSPIGPKVEQVWSLTKDVGLFLKVMRDVRSQADLDGAITRLAALSGK